MRRSIIVLPLLSVLAAAPAIGFTLNVRAHGSLTAVQQKSCNEALTWNQNSSDAPIDPSAFWVDRVGRIYYEIEGSRFTERLKQCTTGTEKVVPITR